MATHELRHFRATQRGNENARGPSVCAVAERAALFADIIARLKRHQGFNVLHPIGFDAFGLPAEQFAIQTGTHPRETTIKNCNRFREQLQSLGFSYDWDREISTTDPEYYK